MTTTPVSLLERLRLPDQPDAWPRFVGIYTPLLYFWARRLGLQNTDADDLVQDVFTTLIHEPASIITLAGILVLSVALDYGWKHFHAVRTKNVQLAH